MKPAYALVRTLWITMLDSPVSVRRVVMSAAQDTIGLCVDGGMGTLSLMYIASLPEEVTQPSVCNN